MIEFSYSYGKINSDLSVGVDVTKSKAYLQMRGFATTA